MAPSAIYFKFFPYVDSKFAVSLLMGGVFEYHGMSSSHAKLPIEERIKTFEKNATKIRTMLPDGLALWFEREKEDVMTYLMAVDEVLNGGIINNPDGSISYVKGPIPEPNPRPDFAAMIGSVIAGNTTTGAPRMDYTGHCGACYSSTPAESVLNIRITQKLCEGHVIECLGKGDYCLVGHIWRVFKDEVEYHKRIASINQ